MCIRDRDNVKFPKGTDPECFSARVMSKLYSQDGFSSFGELFMTDAELELTRYSDGSEKKVKSQSLICKDENRVVGKFTGYIVENAYGDKSRS